MPPPTEPPFRRIAAEIGRRISSGELAPGDRVPSTRQIAREYGVALATATKALTALRLEGLVEARPRVGTVVTGEAGTRAGMSATPAAEAPARELTRERIIRAAIEIADTEGLAALSMRGVAARLGVAAMFPYRYVTSKDDLVLLMADTAFGEETYPDEPPDGWRARLELGARTFWALFRRHPWLAQLSPLTRPLLLPNLIVHAEWLLSALDGHGLDPVAMFDLHVVFYSHIEGLAVNLEREAQAASATGVSDDQWMDGQGSSLQAIASSGRYPVFNKVLAAFEAQGGYDLHLDALFELGLRSLLDGFAGRLGDEGGAESEAGGRATRRVV
ncbi:GntR family transcriptional regulator [Streptomyces sp. NPDC019396]|uniref:GntR family transcriptional regulator n=1 Tax=Streptomyces sp. NPDC019396 TaxID=3154687 RepID=UPI0033D9D4CD